MFPDVSDICAGLPEPVSGFEEAICMLTELPQSMMSVRKSPYLSMRFIRLLIMLLTSISMSSGSNFAGKEGMLHEKECLIIMVSMAGANSSYICLMNGMMSYVFLRTVMPFAPMLLMVIIWFTR